MGLFVLFAGIMHFASPGFFNEIVPPWLPPSESFWTYASGLAEIVIGVMLLRPQTRRRGALAAVWLYVLVYPANIYMTWDWRDRAVTDQVISWVRLPFQFLFIWFALRVASAADDRPAMPGEPA
jgi:uncharacterized membrane protein